jgi:hypothetical protein
LELVFFSEAAAGFSAFAMLYKSISRAGVSEGDEKSEKNLPDRLTFACKGGYPMRASNSSVGGDAYQASRIEGEKRALIAAAGELKP